MPGIDRMGCEALTRRVEQDMELGIRSVLLFGLPEHKDATGSSGEDPESPAHRAVSRLKREFGDELCVIADVCLCTYTDHGHCGVLLEGQVDNDGSLPLLASQAVSLARAGADIIAPSDMMDGRVGAIRRGLDAENFQHVQIMAYAAKYASAFYGPFRDAVGSGGLLKGDKRTYQLDPANSDEALREVEHDLDEGADMVMVKPGLPYLDIIRRVHETFGVPTYAYQVSGEYSMIMAAVERGWLDHEKAMAESLIAFKRAGAKGVLTYFAPFIAEKLVKGI